MSTSRQRRSATAGESRDGGIPATLGRQWPRPITDRLTDRRGLPQGVLRQEAHGAVPTAPGVGSFRRTISSWRIHE